MAEIVIDTALRHPPDHVWRALTEPSALSAWFMATDFSAEPGAAFTFTPHALDGFPGPVAGQVRQVIAPRLLVMSWQEEEAQSSVTWEIEPTPEGCRLTLRQRGFFGVQGTLRRRRLRRTYALLLRTRLPALLDRLAADVTAHVPLWVSPVAAGAPADADDARVPTDAWAEVIAPPVPRHPELRSATPAGLPPAGPAPHDLGGGTATHDLGRGAVVPPPAGPEVLGLAPADLSRERRRSAIVGAGVGAVLAVSVTAGAVWFAAPRMMSSLGAAETRTQVAGSGGVGRAEAPVALTTASPGPVRSARSATVPPAAPVVDDEERARTVPPRPGRGAAPTDGGGSRPGGGGPRPDPGGGPTASWTAVYHTEGRRASVLVGNVGEAPARGWQVLIVLAPGTRLGKVEGARATIDGRTVVFESRRDAAVPANGAVQFHFHLRGRAGEIDTCTIDGDACHLEHEGISVDGTR